MTHPGAKGGLASRLLSGGAWALFGRISMSFGSFVVPVVLARLLSPEDVGVYFLALSFATAAAMAGRAGLEKTTLRAIAELVNTGRTVEIPAEVARTFASAALTIGAVSMGIVLLADWLALTLWSAPDLATLRWALVGWTAFLALEVLVAESFRGLGRLAEASFFGGALSRTLLWATLLGCLIASTDVSLGVAAGLTVAAGFVALAPAAARLIRVVRTLGGGEGGGTSRGGRRQEAFEFLLVNLTFFAVAQSGLWIVGAFHPEEEVALYGAALRLVLVVGLSGSIVNSVLPPFISELYFAGDRGRLEAMVRTVATLAGLPAAAVLILFIFGGGRVLGLAFGDFYAAAHGILAILAFSQLAAMLAGATGNMLIMTGHRRDLLWISLLGAAISIGGGVYAGPRFGVEAVAVAAATGGVVQQIILVITVRRRCGVWTFVGPAVAYRNLGTVVSRLRRAKSGKRP